MKNAEEQIEEFEQGEIEVRRQEREDDGAGDKELLVARSNERYRKICGEL